MDLNHLEKFLDALGCEKTKVSNGGWLKATCPLARWKHGGGRDTHPSFAVMIADGRSYARCLAGMCGFKGSLVSLLFVLQKLNPDRDYTALARFVQEHDAPTVSELKRRLERVSYDPPKKVDVGGIQLRKVGSFAQLEELPVLSEDILKPFKNMTPEILQYLMGPKRRLTKETIEQWELGWHEGSQRIAIPIRDVKGRLVGVSGRAYPDKKPKFLHSDGFRRDAYLFGENRIKTGVMGVVVEGHFDAIYLRQKNVNAVALMGGSMSLGQVEKAVQFFSEVVYLPDGDDAGLEIAKRVKTALERRLPVRIASVPDGKDPDELTDEELSDALANAR